ncbi:hypothetical protein K469DRAFT_701164 [Zopfia rhizophila CBS 207.26]|uniref:Uncharacterized protein n=1 Tax=Zopfia rhizophila CBS 207.26 TaxID=1314779 RepID=A0A6A6EGT2_9PEZI|nr:hypothetical protein K469DRAFT_701164 [Zopfia rhizophila CBS 207.26]
MSNILLLHKRLHTDYILQNLVHKDSSSTITLHNPTASPSNTLKHPANLSHTRPINPFTTNLASYSTPQAPTLSTNDTDRPHRNRQPTKKILNID